MTVYHCDDDGPSHMQQLIGKLVRKKKRENRWVLAIRPLPVKTETGGLVQPVAQNISIPRATDNNSLPYDFLFLFSTLRVTYQGGDEKDTPVASHIELLCCAPDPTAVALALEGISQGRFPWYIIPALEEVGDEHDEPIQKVNDILELKNPSRLRRLAIARLVRGLENGPGAAVDKPARTRPPFIRPNEYLLIKDLEQLREQGRVSEQTIDTEGKDASNKVEWAWMEPKLLETGSDENGTSSRQRGESVISNSEKQHVVPLNLPLDAEHELSFRGRHTRSEYMLTKKMPQVRRMVQRVRQLFFSQEKFQQPRHIVDVGGGRCDLASALALGFPNCIVTVVDKNETSLMAGKEFCEKLGCASRMNFVSGDMGQIVAAMNQDTSSSNGVFPSSSNSDLNDFLGCLSGIDTRWPKVDLVVALHACGDLSDLALSFANQLQVPFVVCPCCYTKRYISNFTPIWDQYCPLALPSNENKNEGPSSGTVDKDLIPLADSYRKSLVRLAEIDDNMHVSRLARVAINSMRLCGMQDSGGYQVSLEEYDIKTSRRNIVLVGYR